MKTLIKVMVITGAILSLLLVIGAIINAYGFKIPIYYITNLSIPISIIVYVFIKVKAYLKESK